MQNKAIQVRLYPSNEQQILLGQTFGCARWWWNYALNKSIEAYKETGKGLGRSALNALLPDLKKSEETAWLADCYSQVLQATTLLCSNCFYQVSEMPVDVRDWTCPHCGAHHDRDGNAAINIRAEGIRIIQADGAAVSAVGGEVRPKMGRKSNMRHSPLITEADTVPFG